MNDDEIALAVTTNGVLAVIYSKASQRDKAQMFAALAVRIIAYNYGACQRWVERRKNADA